MTSALVVRASTLAVHVTEEMSHAWPTEPVLGTRDAANGGLIDAAMYIREPSLLNGGSVSSWEKLLVSVSRKLDPNGARQTR